jgi:hypothetical protein
MNSLVNFKLKLDDEWVYIFERDEERGWYPRFLAAVHPEQKKLVYSDKREKRKDLGAGFDIQERYETTTIYTVGTPPFECYILKFQDGEYCDYSWFRCESVDWEQGQQLMIEKKGNLDRTVTGKLTAVNWQHLKESFAGFTTFTILKHENL